jgi:hypothetical protein
VARAVDQEVLGEIEVRIRGWRVHAVECARGRWWRARVVSGW